MIEKLGLYDLLSIFITGVIIFIIVVCSFNLNEREEISNFIYSIYVFPISYFIGLLFNEIGNFIYNTVCFFRKKNIILNKVINKDRKYRMNDLTDAEICKLKEYINNCMKLLNGWIKSDNSRKLNN